MEKQASTLGFALERLQAIDYLSSDYSAEIERAAHGTGQSPGQVACTFSHRKAWRMFLDSKEDAIAIFEDDALFAPAIASVLAGRLPPGIDLLKLETTTERVVIDRADVGQMGPSKIRRLHHKHMGSCGYILTRKAAAALLAETDIIDERTTDALIFPHGGVVAGIETYQLVPAVCIQERRHSEPAGFATLIGTAAPKPKLDKTSKIARELVRPAKRAATALANWRKGRISARIPFE